eukprot:scaffold32205_cov65-Phaeocystis_antarctica.AAC.3
MRCGARCGLGGVRAWAGGGTRGLHREGPTKGWRGGQWCTGGAHNEHVHHVCDFGRVEVQRLVERPRERKHAVHACDAGRIEAQRLVERRRAGGPARSAKHAAHVRNAGGVPARNIHVEVRQASEELAHVGDGRDVPVGDEAVCRSGGSRVSVVRLDRRLQGGLGRECGRAASRTPARAIASRGEGRGARPRATDEQLVGVGQGVCVLCRVARRAHGAGRGAEYRKAGGGG